MFWDYLTFMNSRKGTMYSRFVFLLQCWEMKPTPRVVLQNNLLSCDAATIYHFSSVLITTAKKKHEKLWSSVCHCQFSRSRNSEEMDGNLPNLISWNYTYSPHNAVSTNSVSTCALIWIALFRFNYRKFWGKSPTCTQKSTTTTLLHSLIGQPYWKRNCTSLWTTLLHSLIGQS